MISAKTRKVSGVLCELIGLALCGCFLTFSFYFASKEDRNLGILVSDIYLGLMGVVFCTVGIYSLISENVSCLEMMRVYHLITAAISVFYAVFHTLVPLYNNFTRDIEELENAFYFTATGFILFFIHNIYCLYSTHYTIINKKLILNNTLIQNNNINNDIESQLNIKHDYLNTTTS